MDPAKLVALDPTWAPDLEMWSPSIKGQQESPSTTISSQLIGSPSSVGPTQASQSHPTPLSTPAESRTAGETPVEPDGALSSPLPPAVPQRHLPALVNTQDLGTRTTLQPAATERCRYCTLTFSSTSTLRQVSFSTDPLSSKSILTSDPLFRRHINSKHQYPCEKGCVNVALSSGRDRERHYNTGAHLSRTEPKDARNNYRCRCGKLEHRKDRHLPHVRNCRAPTVTTYSCRLCQQATDDKSLHQSHLQTCLGAKGRPKKRT